MCRNRFPIFRGVCHAIVLLMLAAPLAGAGTITDLAQRADAIVVGSVATGTDAPDHASLDIAVERLLKGEGLPAIVHVEHPWRRTVMLVDRGSPAVPINPGIRGIWFLRRLAPSGWDVLVANGRDGFLPALCWPAAEVLPAQYQYPPGAPLADALTFEVGAVAKRGFAPEILLEAVHSLNTSAVQAVLSDFLQSPAPWVKSVALAGLLERGQAGSIAKLLQAWPAISKDDRSKRNVLTVLDISFRPEDPDSVREVATLAQTSTTPAELRPALVKVLVAVHTREALPFLATLLRSDDPKDRMAGVSALASFANGCPAQTPETIRSLAHLTAPSSAPYQTPETLAHLGLHGSRTPEAEAELLSFWTTWWNNHPELH
jgi:hypothetical protein